MLAYIIPLLVFFLVKDMPFYKRSKPYLYEIGKTTQRKLLLFCINYTKAVDVWSLRRRWNTERIVWYWCWGRMLHKKHSSPSEIMRGSCGGFIIKPPAHFIKSSPASQGSEMLHVIRAATKYSRLLQFSIFYSRRDAFKYVLMVSLHFPHNSLT